MKIPAVLVSLLVLNVAFCEESSPKTDSIADALTSFNWSWENGDSGTKSFEEIQFFQDGRARNSKYFTARWEATGPRTVVLHNTNPSGPGSGKKAYLVFDAAFTRFIGIDFNGRTNVEGFRRELLDPFRAFQKISDRDVIGTWNFTNHIDGHTAVVEINADNSYTEGGTRLGTWEIKDKQMIVHLDNRGGHHDRYNLPVRDGKLDGINSIGQTLTITRDRKAN